MRTLILSLLIGTGVSIGAADAFPGKPGRTTVPLAEAAPSVVFLGIEGDYRTMDVDKMSELLTTAHELELLGSSLRADTDSDRRVWAVVSKDSSSKLAKSLKRPLKKLEVEFEVVALDVTVLTPLASAKSRDVRAAVRAVERDDNKIPVIHHDRGTGQVWVFHEQKLNSKKVEKIFRDTGVLFDFHHQEFDLTAGGESAASADLDSLSGSAGEKLDLVRSSRREDALVLDLYLRDVSSMQLLEKSKRHFLCPQEIGSTLLKGQPAGVEWSVTLSNDGFPFVD